MNTENMETFGLPKKPGYIKLSFRNFGLPTSQGLKHIIFCYL